jgi:hypothetical protein
MRITIHGHAHFFIVIGYVCRAKKKEVLSI